MWTISLNPCDSHPYRCGPDVLFFLSGLTLLGWKFAWLVLLYLVSGCFWLVTFFLFAKWAAGGMEFTKRSFYDWVHWPYYIARQGNWWLVMYCWGFLTGSEFLSGHTCYLLHVTRRAAGLSRSHSLSWLFCLLRLLVCFYLCMRVLQRLDPPLLRMGQLGSCFQLYVLSFV